MNLQSLPVGDLVKKFQPLDAAAYLRLHGWLQQEIVPDLYAKWTKQDARGELELLLPLSIQIADLSARVRDVLETLVIDEQRTPADIAADLMTPSFDIVRVRLAPEGDAFGTLGIEEGAGAFARMRDLLLAAACAAISPRRVYAKRKPYRAMEYLREARFGQTANGSYVLTILSPVSSAFDFTQQPMLLPDIEDEPFPRRVVRTLAEALAAIGDATQKAAVTGSPEVFEGVVSRGVSANLCEALAGLSLGSGEHGFEFSFSWAPSRQPPSGPLGGRHFSRDVVPYLEQASRHFRQTGEIEAADIVGIVHKLEHVAAGSGRVTIVGTADGERRTVFAELCGEAHQLAIRSYEERLTLACVGEMAKEGGSFRLRNARDVRILDGQAIETDQ